MFVPSNAYDNFKAAVLDKYAADETIQSNYSNKIVFIEQTRQLWVKGVFYDAGLPEIQKTLQADINTRLKQIASKDQQYLGVATSNNVATLNVKKDAIHNYVVDNVWWDYTPPIISGKNSNNTAFNIYLNGNSIEDITPDSTGVWSYDLSGVNITSAYRMFSGCISLIEVDISSFDTEQIKNMEQMFNGCSNLTSLDFSSFNTSNVTNMTSMFNGCSNLTSLDFSSFNTSNVTNMTSMFNGCSNLTSLDLNNFDTSNVTRIGRMFWNCNNLTTINVSSFNTSKVTDMNGMFYGCSNLSSLDLSNFDTSNVITTRTMFYNCNSLTKLDISSFNMNNVTVMTNMFKGCTALTSIYVTNCDEATVAKIKAAVTDAGLSESIIKTSK